MKCPKCGYIGFEAVDRCRNCGYEFALAISAASPADLDMRSATDSGGPLIDLSLSPSATPAPVPMRHRTPGGKELDLNRVIGAPDSPADLPLFEDVPKHERHPVVTPPPARKPLSVRRVTPAVRVRPAPAAPSPGLPARNLELPLPVGALAPAAGTGEGRTGEVLVEAPAGPRAMAAGLDTALLLGIDLLVVYFTLRLCALTFGEVTALPFLPLAAFFLLLNGGYLVAFTAAGGQTIGKMAFGLKVVGPDDDSIPVATASLRSAACLGSALLLGAGLLPAVLGGRAVHDRLAGTRVVQVPT